VVGIKQNHFLKVKVGGFFLDFSVLDKKKKKKKA